MPSEVPDPPRRVSDHGTGKTPTQRNGVSMLLAQLTPVLNQFFEGIAGQPTDSAV